MRPTYFASLAVLIGCVESAPDSTTARLVVQPANLNVTVIDGKPVAQPFKATLVDADGEHDVTAETTFVLTDAAFGAWSAATLELTGEALGPTEVVAAHGDMQVRTAVTVYARNNRIVDAPSDAAMQFDSAFVDSSCEPSISYPADGVVVPQNLGSLDVQWSDSRDDLFEVSFATTYVETRVYTRRTTKYIDVSTQLAGADWTRLAGQHEPIALRVSGIATQAPALRCTTAPRQVYLTDQPLTGSLYISNSEGIYRIDTTQPSSAPEQLLSSALWDAMFAPIVGGSTTSCMGCSFSRDGSRFAVSSDTAGAIYDFDDHTLVAAGSHAWSFATFNLNGSKLITSDAGNLRVIADNGTLLTTLVSNSGDEAFDPQVSPDGRSLANVKATTTATDFGSSIVTRPFFDGSNEMGSATEIVPFAPGTSNFYPSWSPDGRWLVFTRATSSGALDFTASIWIVRADGSQPPIQLTAPTQAVDARARFAPTLMSVDGEPMFYITFESRQAFGELAAGRMQVWAMPFYPGRIVGAAGPTGPAIHLPAQSMTTDNRILQWLN